MGFCPYYLRANFKPRSIEVHGHLRRMQAGMEDIGDVSGEKHIGRSPVDAIVVGNFADLNLLTADQFWCQVIGDLHGDMLKA